MGEYEWGVERQTKKHANTQTDTNINTMTWSGLGAGPSKIHYVKRAKITLFFLIFLITDECKYEFTLERKTT